MGKGTLIGFSLLVGGIILLIAYGLYLGFDDLVEAMDIVTGFVVALILIGLAILIVSIIFEQRKDTKEMKEKIKKEDLEP